GRGLRRARGGGAHVVPILVPRADERESALVELGARRAGQPRRQPAGEWQGRSPRGTRVLAGRVSCSRVRRTPRTPVAAVVAFSGGVIGPPGTPREYDGSMDGTPVFLGCSDRDPHIPLERVRESGDLFRRLGGQVDERIYPRMGHTINDDE